MAVREVWELKANICALRESTGVAILAHSYQEPDILEIADAVGDSVELAVAARALPQRRLIVCGVYFVAETIKLLCPDKEIILAHSQARCPMSGQIYPGRVSAFREANPGVCIVSCVSAPAAVKALSDLCVTPGSALETLRTIPEEGILFLSDCNLGGYIADQLPDKHIRQWSCRCPVLNSVEVRDVELARQKWPEARLLVNCGCAREVVALGDMSGGTEEIMRYCENAPDEEFIIADEVSVCQTLARQFPERLFHQLAPTKLICINMKVTTLETVERTLRGEFGLTVEPDSITADDAARPLERLLSMS